MKKDFIVAKRGGDELMYYVFSKENLWRLVQKHQLTGVAYQCSFDLEPYKMHGIQVLVEDWKWVEQMLLVEGCKRRYCELPQMYNWRNFP